MPGRKTVRYGGLLLVALVGLLASFEGDAQNLGNLKHDATKPIEITADRLEVRQAENTATFLGNVKAVQGGLTLDADEVKVYYRADSGTPAGEQTITRIDANGHVSVVAGEDNAQAEWGIYDVDRALLTLGGAVSLLQGDSAIQAERLEIDIRSGLSRLVGAPGEGNGERVKGVFTPPDKSQ